MALTDKFTAQEVTTLTNGISDRTVLQVGPLAPEAEELLRRTFDLVRVDTAESIAARPDLAAIEAIATSGKVPLDAALMGRLRHLRIISCLGAGTDGIDMAEAARRGISVATTASVLAGDVADVAMGLVIVAGRDFIGASRHAVGGKWQHGRYPLGQSLSGARLGIVGLGNIGNAVATRATAFGMQVAYHSRRRVEAAPWNHVSNLVELALWSDFLVLCCPGGEATRRLVGREVLVALGAEGRLINVSRGSVVDEAALIDALDQGVIAAAGLDVCENEPNPSRSLADNSRVFLLPHIGSATTQTRTQMAEAMVKALTRELCDFPRANT
ncbi:MAG: 2-hydroxyacid dehydrogenase [Rhizobiaceae bacterium]|nr:2-hydroxyacid dehydrogenase [Rhizobiaceae bacterium]